jgi:hypothetical protein
MVGLATGLTAFFTDRYLYQLSMGLNRVPNHPTENKLESTQQEVILPVYLLDTKNSRIQKVTQSTPR